MRKLKLPITGHSLPFWDMLSDGQKVELAQAYNLPVLFVETPFGTEIRLKGIYYGDDEDFEKIMQEKSAVRVK